MTTTLPRIQLPPLQVAPLTPSPPSTPRSPTNRREELAEFAARVCYTLWHGASLSSGPVDGSSASFSPRSTYQTTPETFIRLVNRTLHPHLSPHVAPVALLYVQRYVTTQRSLPLTPPGSPGKSPSVPSPGSEARIWCTALLLAMKQNDDRAAASRYWAPARVDEQAGGMTPQELAAMEREFLQGIDWRLRILPEDYAGWLTRLRRFKEVMEAASTPTATECPPSPVSPLPMPTKKRSVDMTTFESDRRRMMDAAAALVAIKQQRSARRLTVVYSPPRKRSMCETDVQERTQGPIVAPTALNDLNRRSILEEEFISSPEVSSSDESC